jgi:inosine-uridine nucleoside N-ribohydrolase
VRVAPPPPRRIHIDTDPGLDDLLALALAFASPELELVGVTTVSGNARIEAVTENAQRFLALLGSEVPLGRGAATPLALSAQRAEHFHGKDGRRGLAIPAIDRRPLPPARDVLRASLRLRRAEALVALGPLTNVAALWLEEPALFAGVEVVWMGGTLGRGNATAAAEFNCFADPRAAEIMLGAGIRVRVVGLDVTETVRVGDDALAGPAGAASALGRFVAETLSALVRAEEPYLGERRACLHDPCALFAAFEPELFRFERRRLGVRVEEGAERGRLYALEDPTAPAVHYAADVRRPEIVREFTDRLAELCAESRP